MRMLRHYQRMVLLTAVVAAAAPPTAAVAQSATAARAGIGAVAGTAGGVRGGAEFTTRRIAGGTVVSGVPSGRAPAPVVRTDIGWLAGFGAASALMMTQDAELQRVMQRRWVQDSPLLSNGADLFNAYGSPGVFVGSLALFGAGWATGEPDVARLGLRASEAIMLSGIVTGGIKGFAGRGRPYASPGNPHDFRIMSGLHDGARQSFPSGHTTAVFAFASALDRELRVTRPRTARWAAPALYAAATLTGLARMHSDNHWASDVIMGAGIGLISGWVVARFHADRPPHWIDARLLPQAR